MDPAYVAKKVLSFFLEPVGFVLFCWFVGCLLLLLGRRRKSKREPEEAARANRIRRRAAIVWFGIGFAALYLLSTAAGSGWIVRAIESRAPDPADAEKAVASGAPPSHIVVLAHGSRSPDLPDLSRLSYPAFARVAGGVDLWKRFPRAIVVFTGHPKETKAMRAVAERLGVSPGRIWEETESRDTKDHAAYLAPVLQGRRFFLVTSATHVPRSAGLFRGQGLDPVAVPIDFQVGPSETFRKPKSWVPEASYLARSDVALHEWVGLAWARIRGQWAPEPRTDPGRDQEPPPEDASREAVFPEAASPDGISPEESSPEPAIPKSAASEASNPP